MREFFGIGGYTREPEGFLSWQHLLFVDSLLTLMTVLAIVLGRKNRFAAPEQKNKVLIAAALLIDGLELFKFFILLREIFHLSIFAIENLNNFHTRKVF